jgi:hypothetical protein
LFSKSRKRKQVKVKLVGGLGNQLFCYFAGYSVATRASLSLVLDTSDLKSGRSTHKVSIESFILPGKLIYNNENKTVYLLRRIFKRLIRVSKIQVGKNYISNVVGYDSNLNSITKSISLSGYFQSYKYVEPYLLLFKDLKLRKPNKHFLEIRKQITSSPSTAIHVRRGDYLNLSHQFGLLDSIYYRNAFEIIKELHPNQNVYIFSDDIRIAKKLLSGIVPSNSWWIDEKFGAAESLLLMSYSSAIIIANSTFSWWGAMLGNEKTVIAPKKWFKSLNDPEFLYPPSWKLITSHWIE